MLNLKSTMTVAAISEFADNTIFIHCESLCLVTLELTAIPEFLRCLVLGRWKALLIPPSLEESSEVSYPSILLVVDPRWSSLTSLLPLLCSLGIPSSLLSPSSAAFSATLVALATVKPLVGGSRCLPLLAWRSYEKSFLCSNTAWIEQFFGLVE